MNNHYNQIRQQIDEIARRCGRNPAEIKLIAVSKGHTKAELFSVMEAGCLDFGENKVQEFLQKSSLDDHKINWHFLGNLQQNKIRKVIGKLALIHSVDSLMLAEKISEYSKEEGVVSSILLQVNISEEKTKHGFLLPHLKESINSLLNLEGINIKGLMTMAPLTADENIIRACFGGLRETRDYLRYLTGKSFSELSMGMSRDFSVAIEEGATLLRIGTAIFN